MTTIRNPARMAQLLDFGGLKFGKCSPTDIDMSMDWQGKTFVFVEVKMKGAGLTRGQSIHLKYLVNAIVASGREAYAIYCTHDVLDTKEPVILAQAKVQLLYKGGPKWHTEWHGSTLDKVLGELYTAHCTTHNIDSGEK